MFRLFTKRILAKNSRRFAEQLRQVKVLVYAELKVRYQNDLDLELASILAAQVVNYLSGEDLDHSYAIADEASKAQIRQIKGQILRRADGRMRSDQLLRETIVYTHRMKTVLRCASDGAEYLQSAEYRRSYEITLTYGAEFPKEASPQLYDQIFARFLAQKEPFLANAARSL